MLNVLTGNLDRPGGAMFTKAAAGAGQHARRSPASAAASRVAPPRQPRARPPETFGELPAVVLAEEIDTPGEGQIRALVTVAGNPVLSHAERRPARRRARPTLDFMVSVDIYVNETTRHADVILPPPPPLQKGHYDLALLQLAVRNVANYSAAGAAARRRPARRVGDARPAGPRAAGQGRAADPALVDDLMISTLVAGGGRRRDGPVHGRDVDEILGALAPRTGPERILDFLLRTGPYGDGFGADPDGLSLDALLANPHGIDLGALEPRAPRGAPHPDGHDRAGARAAPRRRRRGCRGGLDGRARPTRSCWSAAATCARTTRGCTTSRCW